MLTQIRAYPTPYFTVVEPIAWPGVFPRPEYATTCCDPDWNAESAVPQDHYSFPSLTGSTNSADPTGWLYTIAASEPLAVEGSQNVSSLFAPATIQSVRQHCPHPLCAVESSALAAFAVSMAGALLETSTVHVTGTFSTSALPSPAATAKQTKQTSRASSEKGSVLVDPVAATKATTPASTQLAESIQTSSTDDLGNNIASLLGSVTAIVDPSTESLPPADAKSTSPADTVAQATQTAGSTTVFGASQDTATISTATGSPSKEGATAVQAVTGLLKITADGVTYELFNSLSKPTQASSVENPGDSIASLLDSLTAGLKASVEPQSPTDSQSIGLTDTAAQATQPPIIIGSSTMTANAESAYIVAGQTLVPGSSITVSGTPIALQTAGSDGSALVIGSSTSVLQQNPQATVAAAPPVIVGGSTLTPNSASEYVVDGQTLKAGSSITVGRGSSTSVVELQTEGSRTILVIGSSSSVLQPQPTAVVTIGSARITPNADSEYVVGSQTLAPGASAITISGVEYSLAPDGGQIVAGSSTLILTSRPALTVGSAKITPVANSEYVIGSQTLSPGASAITVSGVKYSLASDGGQIIAGSSTEVLTSEAGVGGYIWSALGSSSAKSSDAHSQETTTSASSKASSTTEASPLESATESQTAVAPDVARPLCLWLMVGWTFAVAWV